ncbi:AraC family transcriptional regulator [Lentzea sp. NPDC051838]|uniref:AraC family transcriptional regulator n=1 Tax=Lentzea sp. NPDC051838 TaxID=3154849 RepID=UPI003441BD38
MSVEAPLAGHEVLDTTDVDEARAVAGRVFREHQLTTETGQGFRTILRSTVVGGMSLSFVDYQAAVRIRTSAPSSGYLVHIPLCGRASITCGRDTVTSDPRNAVVVDPSDRLDMTWSSGTPHLIVGLDRERLVQHTQRFLGRTLDRPLRFGLGMDLTTAAARAWLNVVHLLLTEVSTAEGTPMAAEQLESLVFQRFLLTQPGIASVERPVAPKAIRRAMTIIEEHADEPLTVEDIAEAVGVGVRSLQAGFRRFADTTPLAYLRDVRLGQVHTELLAAEPGSVNVTDVATRWAFPHLGRFSVQYRERFGESPSATLRR